MRFSETKYKVMATLDMVSIQIEFGISFHVVSLLNLQISNKLPACRINRFWPQQEERKAN